MCLGAIYWARIGRIYYGNTRKDAADIQFADYFIYEELDRPLDEHTVPIVPLLREEAPMDRENRQDRILTYTTHPAYA